MKKPGETNNKLKEKKGKGKFHSVSNNSTSWIIGDKTKQNQDQTLHTNLLH